MKSNEVEMDKAPSGFDTKGFQEALKAEVKAAGGTKAFYAKHDIIKELLKSTFQTLLDAEMEEHLGYPKHAPEGRAVIFVTGRTAKRSEAILERLR